MSDIRALRRAAWGASWVLSTMAACAPSLADNPPRQAAAALPEAFPSVATATAATPLAQTRWEQFFAPPELRALIGEALARNQELDAQLQELVIARAEIGARRGEYLPRVGVGVGAGLEKVGRTTSQGAADEANGVPEHLPDLQFGLVASWEVDLWGRLRDAASAAELRALAVGEARGFLVTQLVAELARTYYELVGLDEQLDILRRNLELQTAALENVRLEKLAARVTELAVQRFEAEVAKNRSRVFELEQQRVEAENRINFLVGRYPRPVERSREVLFTPLPAEVSTGLPRDLLDNRPDVRRAALELRAAELDTGVALAQFYPRLSLDASLGFRAFKPSHLLQAPESMAYALAANLTAPLLNRAGIEADYRAANARQIQAVIGYERAVLQAFTEVSTRLARLDNLGKSWALQTTQVETLERAVEVSTTLFTSARADYVEVLLTRRDALDAQLERIETRKRQLAALVELYQALGGGWRGVGVGASADPRTAG